MSAVTLTLGEETLSEDGKAIGATTDQSSAYWQWDVIRDIVGWSKPLYRIAGRDPETPLPPFREHGQFYTSESWHRLLGAVLKAFTTGAPFRIELRMVRPDRTCRRIACSGGAVRDADTRIVRVRGLVEEVPEPTVGPLFRGHSPSSKRTTASSLAADSLVNAYEDELARVSRQLIDDVCQSLVVIAIEVQQLGPPPPDVRPDEPIPGEGLWRHVDETLSRVYRLAQELRPSVFDLMGLREAIRGLCREYSNRWKVRGECTVSIPPGVEGRFAMIFFRICQAALRDVEITGEARSMVIELTRSEDDLVLRVVVNGEGVEFKAEKRNHSAGFGLASIKEQIHLIGGELVFWSDPLVGAQLEARARLMRT